MGKVAIVMRVNPANPDNIEEIVNELGRFNPNTVDIEDIGFGIRTAKVSFILDDKEGGSEELEEKIKRIPGVSEVDVLSVDLIS